MNLKEAFRYQRFLDGLMGTASSMIARRENCLSTKEIHQYSKVFPTMEDKVVEPEPTDYIGNDAMLAFSMDLVRERGKLSLAIEKTKSDLDIDIDAEVEINKFRQRLAAGIAGALANKSGKTVLPYRGYRLNEVSGSQESFQYDMECIAADAFDRAAFSAARRQLLKDAEETSAAIDLAIVTSEVDYSAPFDINASFDEVVQFWRDNNKEAV